MNSPRQSPSEDPLALRADEQPASRERDLLQLVCTVALACNAAPDPASAQQVALDAVCRTTGWDSGRVLLPRRGGGWSAAEPRTGSGARTRRLRHAAGELAAPDGTARAVQLAAAGDTGSWTRSAPDEPTAGEPGGVLVVGVPVLVDDELVAVLEFLGDERADEPEGPVLAALGAIGVQLGRVVERERSRSALAAGELRQRSIIEHAGDAYVESDVRGVITDWNPAAERMLGWAAAEAVGRTVSEVLVPPRLREGHERGLRQAAARGSSRLDGRTLQLQALHRDGHEIPIELVLSVRPGPTGSTVQAFLRDVSPAQRLAERLTAQHEFLDAVLDSLTDGLVACDAQGRLTTVNRAYAQLFELPDELRPMQEWLGDLQLFEADASTPLPVERSPLARALAGETVVDEELVVGRPGDYRRLRCTARPLLGDHGQRLGAVCGLRDVTAQVAAEQSLSYLRRHDVLSGLPNGTVLREALLEASGTGRRTLVQLYVEDLATVVAAEGPDAGGQLLREVADRLARAVRSSDLVAHLGAERFAVLLRHDARTDPRRLVERLLRTFAEPWQRGSRGTRLSISAGLAAVDGDTVAQAPSSSELALSIARAAGPGRIEVFHVGMAEQLQARTALRDDLEQAVDAGQFTLRYQPQVALSTGRVRGVEALLRWEHPVRGLVRPDDFVPLAEEAGLIVPIGDWVLAEACAQAMRWQAAGVAPVRMSVNVSGRQLDDRFVDEVAATLARTGLSPHLLELEITETVAVREDSGAFEVLEGLRRLGVVLSIDDFGTGYSMLGRLRSLPFAQLKIDRSFVSDITGPGGSPLPTAMIDMAHGLGLQVVAEGVETLDQLRALRDRGCDIAQGYLFARPLEADAVARMLAHPAPLPGFGPEVAASPAAGSPEAADEADLRSLLEEIERLTGLESVYVTRVSDDVQTVLAARNTGDLEVPEGGRWSWPDSLCATALRDGPVALSDVDVRHADNAHVAALGLVSYLGVPIPGPDGGTVGTLCAASRSRVGVGDETLDVVGVYARLVAERLLRQQRHDADRAQAAQVRDGLARRAAFLAEAEASVRDPLTALNDWTELLSRREGVTPQARTAAAEAVRHCTGSLTRRLDRLLDEARTAVLARSLHPRRVALGPHIGHLVAAWHESSAGRPVEVEAGEDLTVQVDPAALDKILGDLLDNAASYSPAGAVTRLGWQAVHTGVEISVVDAGVGLQLGLDPFAPFSRGLQPQVQALAGAGLSLYACRALAEAMGGTLLGHRNHTGGSTFALWLPTWAPAGGHRD